MESNSTESQADMKHHGLPLLSLNTRTLREASILEMGSKPQAGTIN